MEPAGTRGIYRSAVHVRGVEEHLIHCRANCGYATVFLMRGR